MELDSTAAAWLQAARAAKAEIGRLEEVCKHAIEHVQAAMGDAENATADGQPVVTWAWSKPGKRLDRTALEADHGPEFVEKYLVDNTPARPFRILR